MAGDKSNFPAAPGSTGPVPRDDKGTASDNLFGIPSLLAEGLALHRAGQLKDAEQIYRRILALQSDHFDGLHLLGMIFHQRGNHEAAIHQIDLALNQHPENISALNNRGVVLNQLKRFDEALASYDRLLALRPAHAEALYNRGSTLHELKRFDEAVASYDQALALRPNNAQALYNRGNALRELRRFEQALASYDHSLALRPSSAEALCNRGLALCALKRFDEALASYDRALALRPDYAKALSNRGIVLQEQKRYEEALASYDRAVTVQPDYAEAFYNRGLVLHALRRLDEALRSYDRAVALRPDYAEAHANRGLILHELNRFDEALASYDRAIALRPGGYVEALTNRGATFHEMKRFEDELDSYCRAIEVQPDYAEAHYNEGICRLLIGELDRGWEKSEWRWQTKQVEKRNCAAPVWLGSNDIAGKTILLHAEQGFGDMIQFCRYVPLVAERAARVILEVPQPLCALMGTLAGVAQIVCRGEPLPHFDMHCPLLSLPLAFRTRLETIPSATPYLAASPAAVSNWNAALASRPRPWIGLAWSGRQEHRNDHNRSIRLASLSSLLGVDATFVSVQPDIRADDAAVLRVRSNLLHFADRLKNFSDTAALVTNLDLVISVDTSVAHLAGALAKPAWVMLPFIPDWRWLLDRGDSPWYPTARLFRQDQSRLWDNAIVQVHAALQHFIRSQ